MRPKMLMLQCVTIFIPMLNYYSCGYFNNNSFVLDVNNNCILTAMSIDFIIKNLNTDDIRVVGAELFFTQNYTDLTVKLRQKPFTLFNVERQHQMNKKYPKRAVVLIFFDKYFLELIDIFKKFWVKIRRNKLIIITSGCMESRLIVELVALIWSKYIVNFVILNHCNSRVDAYTYFPFGNNQCRIFSDTNLIRLGIFYYDDSSKEKIRYKPEYRHTTQEYAINSMYSLPFFPDKIPYNFQRCPIKILTGVWPPNVINISSTDEAGIEMEFIKTIEKQLNCKITIDEDDLGGMGLQFYENEEPTGRLGQLKNELYDLTFGAVPAHVTTLNDFDATECFLRNVLTFIVPTAGILPSSVIVWTVIEKHTILFTIIVGIVLILSIIISFMHKFAHASHLCTGNCRYFVLKIFVTLLRSLIESSTPILPENKSIRSVYGLWFGSCLVISCYFTTTLTSFFTEPGRLGQIKTVQNIIESKIPISIDELYQHVFINNPEQGKYFRSRNVKSAVPVGLKLASMGKAATFTDVLRARHISVQWVSSNGDSSIYYIEGDNLLSFWNVMVTYKGNPVMERINDIMKRIKDLKQFTEISSPGACVIPLGFWNFQIARYYNRRLIRTMIRQYVIVYNFQHGINNTKSINQFNEGFRDSLFLVADAANGTAKLLMETDEKDIIRRFVRSDKTLVTWDHLSTVFRLWCIGMGMGGLVFLGELLIFRQLKFKYVR